MKLISLKICKTLTSSFIHSLKCHEALSTTFFLMGIGLSACDSLNESPPVSPKISSSSSLMIASNDQALSDIVTTSEQTDCEVACTALAACLVSECSELNPINEVHLAQTCLETCTPQQAYAITSQSCEENIAQLSDRREVIAEACITTDVGSVFNEMTFDVEVTEDVVYAQGLTHSDWSEADGVPMDLLLDVYKPIRANPPKMPVIVFIHGGGFKGGSHKKPEFVQMAHSFAARGWVAFSIDYRVISDFGTLPSDYPEPQGENLTPMHLQQWNAFYPACRDAKAAVRWIRSKADEYALNTDYITAIGGSAGSFIALALGVTNEEDCVDELSTDEDATLLTTHLEHSSKIHTIIDHWGGVGIIRMLELLTPGERFDETDAPISIIHGTEDLAVPFAQAEKIKMEYDNTGVEYAWYPLDDLGHGPWEAKVDDKSLTELAFDFIVEQQGLEVND